MQGFIDFFLSDSRGFPPIILEAKAGYKNHFVGKEQACKYTQSLNCRFVILASSNLYYVWDLECSNLYIITSFPLPDSAAGYKQVNPSSPRLIDESVNEDNIVLTKHSSYQSEASWTNDFEYSENTCGPQGRARWLASIIMAKRTSSRLRAEER